MTDTKTFLYRICFRRTTRQFRSLTKRLNVKQMTENDVLRKLIDSIVEGDRKSSPEHTQELLNRNMSAYDIVTKGCSRAMNEVGELYQQGEYFVPEILMAAKAFEAAMNILEPFLKKLDSKANGTVVIGVCEGDIHSIGKNLVATMLEAAGFSIIDLGSDVPAEKFIEAAIEDSADIIAVSALMTTSMLKMKNVVAALESSNLRAKIMVGGGPVSQDYADKIGAHGYGKDAMAAVRKAIQLMESS